MCYRIYFDLKRKKQKATKNTVYIRSISLRVRDMVSSYDTLSFRKLNGLQNLFRPEMLKPKSTKYTEFRYPFSYEIREMLCGLKHKEQKLCFVEFRM